MNTKGDLAAFARQLEAETKGRLTAADNLKRKIRKAEDNKYASSTIYGQALLRQNVGRVGIHLSKRLKHITKGSSGVDHKIVNDHLKRADLSVVALLTMKVVLDVLGKESKPQLQEVTLPIGRAIETQLRLDFYMDANPDLYKNIEKFFHASTGTRQKETVFKILFNRKEIVWDSWSQKTAHQIGAWCFNALREETGWLSQEKITVGRRRHRTVVRYTKEFLGLKGAILAQAEDLAFTAWPMLCKPVPYDNENRGGYLTEEMRQSCPMVRSRSPLQGVKQGKKPIEMLKRISEVAYCINPFTLMVGNECSERRLTIGKFRHESPRPLPSKPEEDSSKEEIKKYKRARREVEDYNAQLEQKNWRTVEALYVANKFKVEPKWYVPHSFDYRGRIYPLVTALSPQGTDFDKALLYYVDEGPVNRYYLAFHVATCYGLDKHSMDERIEWVDSNTEKIKAIAEDPLGNLSLWADAEEPWCFLASAYEYYVCCIAQSKDTSGLPCGIDATASGIQILSALTLDSKAAKYVNVLPSERPQDGYKRVADASLKYIEDATLHKYITRKVTKRPTMVLPYSGTRESARGYIKAALKETDIDLSIPQRLTNIVRAIYDHAIPEVFAGPVEVMHWLKSAAKEILSKDQEVIKWTTPSGFVVVQDLRKTNSVRVQTRIMGSVIDVRVSSGYGDVDVKHHVNALSPNLIHSYDSSLMHIQFHNWNHPFSAVHDCAMVRSCDVGELAENLRKNFAEIFSKPVLKEWADEVGVEVPEHIIKGTLDIDKVKQSLYFFC